jgi:hypothetical protein
VACSQRKRIVPPISLRLASIHAGPKTRAARWAKRLDAVDAPRHPAEDLYAGDHWQSACEAFRLARRYSSRAELWVVSAGYGLIRSSTSIKPYSATFATGAADSVWRGLHEGKREERLQAWWRTLGHESTLPDLLPAREDGVLVIAAGAAYLTALESDLRASVEQDAAGDRVSVISAGACGNGALLPVSGRFRAALGGTDSALNARLLLLLAASAATHQFSRLHMAARLNRLDSRLPETSRRAGRPMADNQIARRIRSMRRLVPSLSRTQALRELRGSGVACEQVRFAVIWSETIA